MRKSLFVSGAIALCGGLTACGTPVVTNFEATIATIADAPFGLLDEDRGKTVSGSFSWNTATIDSDPLQDSGEYNHSGDGTFRLLLPRNEITGSGFSQVVVANSTSLQITDGGATPGEARPMLVDGVPSETAELSLVMVNDNPVFENGRLPIILPDRSPENWSHTFAVSDVNGTLLLQFTELTDVPQD
ncbi:MAG: hypothetical protein AB8H79_19710 [Myxococcota bacterium]